MALKSCLSFVCFFGIALSSLETFMQRESQVPVEPKPRFQDTLDYLKKVTNLTENPCNAFYYYACGNYTNAYKEEDTGARIEAYNSEHVLAALRKEVSTKALKPVRLAKIYFQKCLQEKQAQISNNAGETQSNAEAKCQAELMGWLGNPKGNLGLAYDRVYVDSVATGPNYAQKTRDSLSKMVRYIILGFRSMVNQVKWLTEKSRVKARLKLDNMAINLVAQNEALNDSALEEYYHDLDFDADESMDAIREKVLYFNQHKSQNTTERRYQLYSNADWVNAAYSREDNSINIPLGIAQSPVFNADWPMEYNFGGLGYVIGHEISHGFDNEGVNFDEWGKPNPWLEPESKKAFQKAAECLVEQYSKFCDLNDTVGNCVDARWTLGENIADNAGIHAAYRGFQYWKDTEGEVQSLPPTSGPLGKLEASQLFFLAMSQFWGTKSPTYEKYQNPHSPAKYRVRGPLPNFPGFENAYSCKKGNVYAPEKHCNIWITPAMHKEFMVRAMNKLK